MSKQLSNSISYRPETVLREEKQSKNGFLIEDFKNAGIKIVIQQGFLPGYSVTAETAFLVKNDKKIKIRMLLDPNKGKYGSLRDFSISVFREYGEDARTKLLEMLRPGDLLFLDNIEIGKISRNYRLELPVEK